MHQDEEVQALLNAIASDGLTLLNSLKHAKAPHSSLSGIYSDVAHHAHRLAQEISFNPQPLWQSLSTYHQKTLSLLEERFLNWQHKEASTLIKDKRFQSESWRDNPFFELIAEHYLLASSLLNELVDTLTIQDEQLAKKVRFFTQQYLDALSPDNFLYTNPSVIAQTVKQEGKNLLKGFHHFLKDLAHSPDLLMIKMTDNASFKVGENLALTPGKVIYNNDLMELIQYTPQTPNVNAIPLLIIPPWINKYYILDLSAHNSLIGWLVRQGITVFVLSWVNPDARHRHVSLEDYLIHGPHKAIEVMQKQLNTTHVNALGFCIGGTLLGMLAAFYQKKTHNPLKSITFLATMLDFSDTGDISVFIDEPQIERLEEQMKETGFLDGRIMATAFNALRAKDLVWSFFINHYLQGKNPMPFDILYWNSDPTNMPAKMHAQYLRWMYLNNDLIKPNKIKIKRQGLDISSISIPSFFIATEKDHIAPWQTVYQGFRHIGGKKRFLLGGSGHIAGIINPPRAEKYGYYSYPGHPQTSTRWLEKAQYQPNSWWPEWLTWLKQRSGREVPAFSFEQLPFKGMKEAPGDYILKRLKPLE